MVNLMKMSIENGQKGIRRKGVKALEILWNILAFTFLFLLLIAFPFYLKDKYVEMSYYKWIFYVSIMVLLLIAIIPIKVGEFILRSGKRKTIIQDYFVMGYGILTIITYINCPNQKAAFMGTDGWYMGAVAQIFFVLSYLIFSRRQVASNAVIGLNYIGSSFCFIVAVFQRYGKDFLHLYWNMPDEIVRDYLSTIGNRTWFSAYVCTVFPIGLYLFWKSESREQLIIFGTYTFLAFSCLVTANSDSAYAGAFLVLYLLLYLSLGSGKKTERFIDILILWFGACILMGLLRLPFESKVRDLRGFSLLFLNLKIAVPCFLLACLSVPTIRKMDSRINHMNKKFWKRVMLFGPVILLFLLVITICLNTSGILQKYFGITLHNSYLLFNDEWGDDRGSSWKLTVKMFMDLPIMQQIFGVGPDCFAYHAYGNQEYSLILRNIWGEAVLANAHNEWLNSFLCMGLAGGIAYIGIFLSVMIHCLKKAEADSGNPLVGAIGLCVAGYIAHNFFCYQQASATAVIFVLMGVAMSLSKTGKADDSVNRPNALGLWLIQIKKERRV